MTFVHALCCHMISVFRSTLAASCQRLCGWRVGRFHVHSQCPSQWDGCPNILFICDGSVFYQISSSCFLGVLLPCSLPWHHDGMKDTSDDLCYWIPFHWCWGGNIGSWQQMNREYNYMMHLFDRVHDAVQYMCSSPYSATVCSTCFLRSAFCFCHLSHEYTWGLPLFGPHCVYAWSCPFRAFTSLEFDQTLGYPGEGPNPTWSFCTANIDAVQTHPDCLEWEFDVMSFQETRINHSNLKQVTFDLNKCNKSLIHGGLLIPKKTKASTFVTPHGGVAIVGQKGFIKNFTVEDDSTGLWADPSLSTRVSAAWVQVLPKVRALVFSFYGETSKHDISHLRVNNFMLERILTVASQFGSIPIILSGDFQADPDSYSAIVAAKQHGRWCDPLCSKDQYGNPTRPVTFSRNAQFINPTEYFSSIDAVLLNQTAFHALDAIEMDYSRAKQHAPIIARFKWPKLCVEGTVLKVPAPLNLTELPRNQKGELDFARITENAKNIWDNKFQFLCQTGDDDNDWNQLNAFALQSLIASGAKFSSGLATRGEKPVFSKYKPCHGQLETGPVSTKCLSELTNFNKQLVELTFRLSRISSNDCDRRLTRSLHLKVVRRAVQLHFQIPLFDENLSVEQVKNLQKQVAERINKKRDSAKRERIKNWKQKMIFGTKTKNVHSFVYKWIKSKSQVEVPNLIVDSAGNILYNPSEAIEEINQQWDNVFSANVLHQDPNAILKFIWPYVDKVRTEAVIPTLDGGMLQKQILRRKSNAAAGIDGWRTSETQCLSIFVLDKIASFFSDIEEGKRQMPKQLATAKQVLLNKNGLDDPMHKRIISLLPIFLLAYTGTRFRQLQEWQNCVFPSELKGGIKGRTMGEIPTNLRLCIDASKELKCPLVGIQLDKSKCFDRIVPSIAAALLLGLGCPKQVVNFFMGIYSTLTRFLCFKQWCSERPTTCANGVVQGCSFSILAINAYMSAWALLVGNIPHIQFAAYVDDSYVWAHLHRVDMLQKALEVTDLWDNLTGQCLNKKKCQAFASNSQARKVLKNRFPDLDHSHVITVLGANLNVTNNKNMIWPREKTTKIIRDLKSIRAIPCSCEVASHLIATKVIPQLNFMASLSHIPKKVLQLVQDEIASSLWNNRPLWRSRWLVLGLLSSPHRTEPFIARAFSTILDTISFLKTTTISNRVTWERQVICDEIQPNSLLASFHQACRVLGIRLISPFCLQLEGFPNISLQMFDFAKRDLKKLLCNLCRHQCYARACQTSRKDITNAKSLLDFEITMASHRTLKQQTVAGMNLSSVRDSTIVGCTITNDRCHRAGFTQHSLCRFCGSVKETMHHLACECKAVPGGENKPECPEGLGPNFPILGIAEVDHSQALDRMKVSDPSLLKVNSWSPHETLCTREVWTDGSCEHSNFFWHTAGGFAVIDHNDCVLDAGEVCHFAISSFTCELWAVMAAFLAAAGPLVVYSDCDSLVKMINQFPLLDAIPVEWPHVTWFVFLLHVYQSRKNIHNDPLKLVWCPSHVLENTPWFLISDMAARLHHTTVRNIRHNRTADRIAKSVVKRQLATRDFHLPQVLEAAGCWQKWLVNVAVQVALIREPASQDVSTTHSSQNNEHVYKDTIPSVVDITPQHPTAAFRYYLPKWKWEQDQTLFTWVSKFPDNLKPSSYVSITENDWCTAIRFFKSLCWCLQEDLKVSYTELAYQFHFSNFRFENDNTVSKIPTMLRKVINQSLKCQSEHPLIIGVQKSQSVSDGKTLPAGYLLGSRPLIKPIALKSLAVVLLHGRQHALAKWDTPF